MDMSSLAHLAKSFAIVSPVFEKTTMNIDILVELSLSSKLHGHSEMSLKVNG